MMADRQRRRVSLPLTSSAPVLLLALASTSAGQPRVRDTQFSHERGFYDQAFTVVVHSDTEGARIRYTLDGGAPSESVGLGDRNPVSVAIHTTSTLRAIAYREGWLPSNVDTQTYVFPEHVARQPARAPGYPHPSLRAGRGWMVELDYAMDPEVVAAPGVQSGLLRGLRAIPTMSIVMARADLFAEVPTPSGRRDPLASGVYYGDESERATARPASVELLHDDGRGDVQGDAAIESHSQSHVKRSFRLKFQREYGPGKLESEIFRDAPLNGDSATDVFDRLVLRAGNTRSWATSSNPDRTCYTRDQWARDAQIEMSGVGAHGAFVHLYLNGLYWGLYNVVERPDAWFLSTYFGGDKEDWFAVNHGGPLSGEDDRFEYLTTTLRSRDMTEPANYEELRRYLDVVPFADYLILAWYMRLGDWPANNWYAGHRNDPPTPLRYFVWDAEYSWRSGLGPAAWVHPEFVSAARSDASDMVGLWHSVRRNADFMMMFADRVYRHCFHDGALTDGRSLARWRILNDSVAEAVIAEGARWGDTREIFGEPVRTATATFRPQVEAVAAMMLGNTEAFIESLRAEGYYPSVDPPEIRVRPGFLGLGANLSFGRAPGPANRGGAIYFTLDGVDPRSPGGEPARQARLAEESGEIPLTRDTTVKARLRRGETWSALAEVVVGARGVWSRLSEAWRFLAGSSSRR